MSEIVNVRSSKCTRLRSVYLSIYPIVLGTVGAPHISGGESWAMLHGGAHPSPCQTTAKILQLGGLPWSRVLDWRSIQPGRWPHRGSSHNQQSSTSIAMCQAVPCYIVPAAGKVPGQRSVYVRLILARPSAGSVNSYFVNTKVIPKLTVFQPDALIVSPPSLLLPAHYPRACEKCNLQSSLWYHLRGW